LGGEFLIREFIPRRNVWPGAQADTSRGRNRYGWVVAALGEPEPTLFRPLHFLNTSLAAKDAAALVTCAKRSAGQMDEIPLAVGCFNQFAVAGLLQG